MNFAFLVHPLGNETDRVLAYLREVDLPKSFGWDMANFIHDMHVAMTRANDDGSALAKEVRVIDELPALVSRVGARTDGRLYEIPMDSFAILEEPDRALEHILAAVDRAAEWGAKIVGLGSMTGIVGGQGSYVAEHAPIAVTTGNSLTVYAAVENLIQACRAVEVDLSGADVVVVGVPGSIATAAARMLRPKCGSLRLVWRSISKRQHDCRRIGCRAGRRFAHGLVALACSAHRNVLRRMCRPELARPRHRPLRRGGADRRAGQPCAPRRLPDPQRRAVPGPRNDAAQLALLVVSSRGHGGLPGRDAGAGA